MLFFINMAVITFGPMNTDFIRTLFPGIETGWILMDNAGGSQIASPVLERMMEFYQTSYVQLGATYHHSDLATGRVAESHRQLAQLINAADPGELIMGSSTSLLLRILAGNLGKVFPKGSEIIVTNCDHEANIGCWMDLEKLGMIVKVWKINPDTLTLDPEELKKLMTGQTRLVAFTHASNVIGTVNPVKEITHLVHSHGAMVCVDGVAYAPHRMIDVTDWDVDFYVFSFYKTYGPHYALLYGKKKILLDLPGNNHFFIGREEIPYKFQPGNVNFEFAWGMTGLLDYFGQVNDHHFPGTEKDPVRTKLARAFKLIGHHEQKLSERLLRFLAAKSNVKIIGQSSATASRLPTISFVVEGRNSESIVREVDKQHIGIRYGDFYARRLIEYLGLASQNGVVRVSMVHYNTMEEVERLIGCLKEI